MTSPVPPNHPAADDHAEPLLVTRPFLPPLAEMVEALDNIWRSGRVTNGGSYHALLQSALAARFQAPRVSLVANGTLGLLLAIKALGLRGEVVTTPFSFVATAHCLAWSGLTPVFADIDAETFNLDPAAAEAAITPKTTALLPVHVFGRPCDTAAFAEIAESHGQRLLYDAAHAFGAARGTDLLAQGDLSVLSFHGTKPFHTFEGGAVAGNDSELLARIDRLRNFGIVSETEIADVGINAKMNEFQAAVGLLQLAHLDRAAAGRARVARHYRAALQDLDGLRCPPAQTDKLDSGYFPILVEPGFGGGRDRLYERLRAAGVFARRYFHPLITDLPMYRALPSATPDRLPVAHAVARRILCLPIFADMSEVDCERVITVLLSVDRRGAT